jgi:uncharacterized repeat protein (TIGR01451 family)
MNSQNSLARQLLVALILCVPIGLVVPLLAWANRPTAQEASLRILSEDPDGMLVQLEVPGFAVDPAVSGAEPCVAIDARGLSRRTASPGYPRLPYHSTLLAIPPGSSVSLLVVEVESTNTRLSLPVESVSGPGPILSFDSNPASSAVRPRPLEVSGHYPEDVAVVSSPLHFRDQRVVRLDLYPFQVAPNSPELIFHRRIVVRLMFTGVEPVSVRQIAAPAASTDRVIQHSILNYEQGRQWRGYPGDMVIPQASVATEVPVYRIKVDHDGMYRVTYHDLVAAGLDVTDTRPLSLSLSSRGNPVAIDWFGDDDQLFEPDEAFVFYGQQFRGTVSEEQYTDVNVYWLETRAHLGLRMDAVTGSPSGAPGVRSYRATVHTEQDAKFTHLHTTELGEVDTWYMQKTNGGSAVTFPVTLTAVASGAFTGSVRLEQFSDCRYTGSPELHQVQVRLNDVPIDTQTWQSQGGTDNCSVHLLSGPIAQEELLEGPGNTVTWIVSTTHPYGEWLNWWEISYQRELDAVDDRLAFGLDLAGEWVFTVTGFTTNTIAVWDVSSPSAPVRILSPVITGVGPYLVSFQLDRPEPGSAIAATSGSLETPAAVDEYSPPSLDPPAGADWIAITHHDFITEVRRLADYRQHQGLRTWVVEIDDIYNQYGAGIYQPAAVRDYLIHGLGWAPPAPSYVVLVGDGNWNYKSVPSCYAYCDPDPIYVPPYMGVVDPYQGQVPADNLYATLVYSDPIPDIALGRLPVRTITETAELVDRIIQHEAQLIGPESWQYDFTFLADEYDPSAGDFHAQSEMVVNQLPAYLSANRIYHMEAPYTSPAATREALVRAFNEGTTLVNYRGHGGILVWGDDGFFSVGYLGLLTNTERLPAVFSFDCLDTYFAIPSLQSLGETMVRNSPAGSVAHWGSSGLGISSDHLILNQALFSAIFERGLGRLGDAILAAKLDFAATGWQMHNLHTFTLLGDPAMPLVASDLYVDKSAIGADFRHVGNSLSYVIRLTNRGLLWGTGAVITDFLPAELVSPVFRSSGLQITPTAGVSYVWMVSPVLPYDHGVITISGRIDPSLASTVPFTITNTVTAGGFGFDWDASNDTATATMIIVPGSDIYLPLLVRGR